MPAPVSRDRAIYEIAHVENAMRDGFARGVSGSNNRGPVRVAAVRMGVNPSGLASRIGTADDPGTIFRNHTDLSVDWSLERLPEPVVGPADEPAAPALTTTDRKYILLQDENRELRAQLKAAHRAASTEEIIRDIIGDFAAAQRESPAWARDSPKREKTKRTPEVPITVWSDWHLGEVVELAEVNGYNKFNMAVAEERVNRLVDTTIRLCRENHVGVYPGIVVNLLGDFVSGGIHPELKSTDEDEVIPSSLKAADWLIAALGRLAGEFKNVYVPCSCGNHGRDTVKPEFKRYYRKNFDWLILQIVAKHFANDKRFQFDIRPSNDVHYRVHGERYLACHGDMLGVRGGDGIIGSIGPIVRGEVKQAGQSSALGFTFDKLVIGHWHQRLWLPRAIVNNALKGFDEFAMKSLGAKPDRPTQALWFVHPSHGMTAHWDIYVDDKPKPVVEWVAWGEAT